MRLSLTRHPDTPCEAVTGIDVEFERPRAGPWRLHYVVAGTIGDILLPPAAPAARTDELWRHTCFEAFVKPSPGDAYYEFNLAPSTQWATYRFDAYRSGMRAAGDVAARVLELQTTATRLELQAALEPPELGPLRLGLCAVIAESNGRISYWALAHPPGKPDFHHPDCFAAQIAAASGP
ncbi:MAG TPA: DOMON-like domain-containing protein [Rhizomicrobium sp.]|jgi:hypothetical protein|nr:DOMON-like domain-containing protein [Rhizomicrobium sp.]